MDYNWFFSSLAQAIASLVGVAAAFVIARLIASQSEFDRKRQRTSDLIRSADQLKDEISDDLITRLAEGDLARKIGRVSKVVAGAVPGSVTADGMYREFGGPLYLARDQVVKAFQTAIDEAEDRRRRSLAAMKASSRTSGGSFGSLSSSFLNQEPIIPQITEPIRTEFMLAREAANCDRVEQWWVRSRYQAREMQEHITSLTGDPESSRIIGTTLVIVVALFWTGVIYPLSFLPVPAAGVPALSFGAFWTILASLRGVLLAIATLPVSALIGFLFYVNRSLRFNTSEIAALESRTEITWYSRHFPTRNENERARDVP